MARTRQRTPQDGQGTVMATRMVMVTLRLPHALAREIGALLANDRSDGDPRRTSSTIYRELLALGLKVKKKEIES